MKKLSILLALFIFSSLCTGLVGCAVGAPDAEPSLQPKTSVVRYCDLPDGVEEYTGAEVTVGGERIPLYAVQVNTSQVWTPNNYRRTESGVALFALKGKATVVVRPDTALNYSSRLRPLSANLIPIADLQENTLTFTFVSAGEYVLEINGDADETIHFFVSEYEEEERAGESAFPQEIVFAAGLHTAQNDARISSDNVVRLQSNTRVRLEEGAVVRAKFLAEGQSNIEISGGGIIDGSTFDRDASAEHYTVTVPLDFNDCTNVTLKDFTVLDPAGWCVNFYFVQNSRIEDIKIITSRSNGDGVSLQSCKDITVDGCFVRTWDDSLVVKNYPRWENRSAYGATERILFCNCTVWTDLAQSMELGYETVGETFTDVRFENITVLHALHNAPISIHNANNAAINGVVFADITIEDGVAPADSVGIIDIRNLFSESWSEIHTVTPLGSISAVEIRNVNVLSARRLSMTIGGCRDVRAGYESEHYVRGVTIADISVAGERPALSDCKILSTGYTEGLTLTQSGEVTGAAFVFTQSAAELAEYGTECRVVKG